MPTVTPVQQKYHIVSISERDYKEIFYAFEHFLLKVVGGDCCLIRALNIDTFIIQGGYNMPFEPLFFFFFLTLISIYRPSY